VTRRKSVLATVLAVILLLAVFACWPRKADLRAFNPAGMARIEAAMWRDYYEKRYGALFYHLYELSRRQFGFSPLDSLRIALAGGKGSQGVPADSLARGGCQRLARACHLLRAAAAGCAGGI